MSVVFFFPASQLGIFSLKIGKNHRFLALGTVPFIGTSYIRKKNAANVPTKFKITNTEILLWPIFCPFLGLPSLQQFSE